MFPKERRSWNPRTRTKWSGDRQPPIKRTQNNDSEDDPWVQKKNGGNTEKVQEVFNEHLEEIKGKQADKQYLERKIH